MQHQPGYEKIFTLITKLYIYIMEGAQNIGQGTIKIKVAELMKKFKHKEDRFNFCRQRGKFIFHIIFNLILSIGFWLPNEPGFDSTFFVKFLKKEKEVDDISFTYNSLYLII